MTVQLAKTWKGCASTALFKEQTDKGGKDMLVNFRDFKSKMMF